MFAFMKFVWHSHYITTFFVCKPLFYKNPLLCFFVRAFARIFAKALDFSQNLMYNASKYPKPYQNARKGNPL